MLIESFPAGLLGCNCVILGDETTSNAFVIDPGGDLDTILARLTRRKLKVVAILHTHTHIDHVGATGDLQRATGAPARIHEADRFLYEMLGVQASFVGMPTPTPSNVDCDLVDNGSIEAGTLTLRVLHTPGHSPGSVCFYTESGGSPLLLSGDTLFQHGVGRTDLWGGNSKTLIDSIQRRLYTLNDATRVIPGHGEETTIGNEKSSTRQGRVPIRG